MMLTIEIRGIDSAKAVCVLEECAKAIKPYEKAELTFKFSEDDKPIFRGEETTFSRYLNATQSEV